MAEIIGLVSMLGICSVEDLVKKQIHIVVIACFGILGVLFHLYYGSHSTGDMVGGMGVGVAMYLLSLITKGKIGKGDAFLIMTSGVYLGFWKNLFVLWLGSLLTGMIGLILYLFYHKKPNYRLPFAPFVLVAYLILLSVDVGV